MKKINILMFFKKTMIAVCTAIFVLSIACFMKLNGSVAKAAESSGENAIGCHYISYTKENAIASFGQQDEIPVATGEYAGWLFGGWFADSELTIPVKTVSEIPENGAYAKFVNPEVLSMKLQIKTDAAETTATNMRLVSTVDGLDYRKVGFLISYNNATPIPVETSTVYQRIIASATSGVDYNYSPKVVGTESEYFVTATLLNIKSDNYGNNFDIQPYWVTYDGVKVYGVRKNATVNDGITSTVINATATANLTEGKTYDVTYGTTGTATAYVISCDGTYANVRITLTASKTTLNSVTKFTIENGEADATVYYRNLETSYTGAGTADSSWYDAYDETKTDKYVIATSADLYGMEYLANYNGGDSLVTFSGKTIYVIADITVNEWTASIESGWTPKEGTTRYNWYAVKGFAGIFEGQGHTISGLYGTQATSTDSVHYSMGIGLFTETKDAFVQDLHVINSYYKVNTSNGTGMIVGQGSATLCNVYTDGVIYDSSTKGRIGGVIGHATGTVNIDNCFSNTDITSNGPYNAGVIGNANGNKVTVRHCLNAGNVTYTGTGNAYAGGLVGRGDATGTELIIHDCLNIGDVEGVEREDRLGSILGTAAATGVTITKSYSIENYKIDGTSILPDVGNDARTDKSGTKSLSYQDLYDMNAFCNTDLSYDGYVKEGQWAIRNNNTPMLISFLDKEDEVIGVTGRSKTDFVIVDGVGYISVLSQLVDFRDKINAGFTFKEGEVAAMTDDIAINADADAGAWANGSAELPSEAWVAINGFNGVFDGQGHTIHGLYTNKHSSGTGLFTKTNGAVIRNLSIEEGYIKQEIGTAGTGMLVGVGNGTFENIKVNGIITSTKQTVGGLIGCVDGDVTITNCWSDCDITTSGAYAGGMIGNYTGTVPTVVLSHCLNTGNLTSSANYLGGLVGRVASTSSSLWTGCLTITDCMNAGIIANTKTAYTGGLVGYASGKYGEEYTTIITNSYNAVEYDAEQNALGIETLIGSSSSKEVSVEGCSYLAYDKLLNINSYYYTNLDLYSSSNQNAYWVARESATPILASFCTGDKLNISNMSDTTFVLINNKGYIANASQMMSFATQMNATTPLATDENTVIKVVNDIDMDGTLWTPVLGYDGTFEGNRHTLRGFNISTDNSKGCGLFTMTDGVDVKNLSIKDTTVTAYDGSGTGVVIGKGNGTIENVSVEATMNSSNKNAVAGIIGYANGKTTIRNCWNQTDIISSGAYCGGVLGNASTGLTITIKHCLNSGNISYTGTGGGQYGGIVGRANGGTATTGALTIRDCLNVGIVKAENTSKPFIGGLLGYAPKCEVNVNQGTTIIDSYSAKIYVDDVLQGTEELVGAYGSATYTVKTGSASLTIEELNGIAGFSNTSLTFWNQDTNTGYWASIEGSTPILMSFVTSDIKVLDISNLSKTEFRLVNNQGTISNAEQLSSFRDKLNAGVLLTDVNTLVQLTNDIVLNEGWEASETKPAVEWTPVQGFTGTFDGKGYTISGLYATSVSGIKGIGLFTETKGATIQNLRITNSYFKVNTSNGSGPVIGLGSGKVKNVYTEAILIDNNASVKGRIGGIVGKADGDVTIENCWSNSFIESKWTYVGGIIGYSNSQNVTVEHCLNTGALLYTGTAGSYFGGIVGSSCSSGDTTEFGTALLQITDCLNVGAVSGTTTETYMGGIIGNAGGKDESEVETVVIENSYATINYDENDNIAGVTKTIGNDYGAVSTSCESIPYDSSLGELGYNYMNLDFVTDGNSDGYWVVREHDTPMLVSFLEEDDIVLNTFSVSKTPIIDVSAAYGTEIPQYQTASTRITNHNVGKGGYEVCIQESSQVELNTYAERLAQEGFLHYSTKTVPSGDGNKGENLFYTYVGKGINLYLSWNPGIQTSRVIMTPQELLPMSRVPKIGEDDTVTPSVTQMQFDGLGMSYVVQLADGSFIIVDGGTNSFDSDSVRLYQYLVEKSDGNIPKISCWMYTHPDPDHIGLSTEFLKKYAGMITIKSFAYNFPTEEFVTSSQDDKAIFENIETLEANMKTYYPNALQYNIHAGQSYYFTGVEIEILQTEEEFYPNIPTLWNDTSAAWRMKFRDGQTVLYLGDSMQVLCKQLADTYGEYLKSEVLQMAHHGLIGGDLKLYQSINPSVCFWSTTEENYMNEEYRSLAYNYYLLTNGTRTFYWNAHMGTVLLNNGAVNPQATYTIPIKITAE